MSEIAPAPISLAILPLLKEMRGRLGKFLGRTSLPLLAAFLRGYDYAAEKLAGREPDPFLTHFRDWIQQRFQTTRYSWEEIILRDSADEAEAVKRFWELLDEFLGECPEGNCPTGLNSGDQKKNWLRVAPESAEELGPEFSSEDPHKLAGRGDGWFPEP
jgi:hypothetical protein